MTSSADTEKFPDTTSPLGRRAFTVGLVAAAITAGGWSMSPVVAAGAWLWTVTFWISVPLGCLAVLLIHALTGGRWGDLIGRDGVAAVRTLLWTPLAFLPVALSMEYVYPWARPEYIASSHSEWLTLGDVQIRAGIYFVVWVSAGIVISRDWRYRCRTPGAFWRYPRRAAVLLMLFFLSSTFAAIDWMMSLEPEFYSSLYGAQFAIGCIMAGVAFLILCRAEAEQATAGKDSDVRDYPSTEHADEPARSDDSNDRGNLLLAAVMVWMYFLFSQFFIIWSGDLPQEAEWYLVLSEMPWRWLTILMVVLGFVLPLMALLSRDVKEYPRRLAVVAAMAIVARILESIWLVVPALPGRSVSIHWLDVTSLVALGGLWLAAFEHARARTRQLHVVEGTHAVPASTPHPA